MQTKTKCLICHWLRCQPAVYGDAVWCKENIFQGMMLIHHPFLRTERACKSFEEEGEKDE